MIDIASKTATSHQARDAASDLQATLVDLVDLSLQAKQLHWNVTGANFRPLHQMLDEFTGEYRDWADTMAERLAAIGVAPDGRVGTVARESSVEALPSGRITGQDIVHMLYERLSGAAHRVRERMDRLGEIDLASQDVLIELVRGLEKQVWMVEVQRS